MKLSMKIFFFTLLISISAATKTLVDKVVAAVNDEIVLLSELDEISSRVKKSGGIDETLLLKSPVDSLKDNKFRLEFLVREKIIESEVKRLNMTASTSTIDAEVNAMAKSAGLAMPQFIEYVKHQGYTLEEFKKTLKTKIERQEFFKTEIINKLRITDEDAYTVYLSKVPNSKQLVGEFTVAQIFFSSKKSGGSKAALERAQATLEKITAGEKFETLANQLDETAGANKDGFLGKFKAGEFISSIEKAIGTMDSGQTSNIIQGPNGFHIVKLIDKTLVPDPNFVRVKEQIKASLIQENFEKQLKTWFEQKKQDAVIKYYNEAT